MDDYSFVDFLIALTEDEFEKKMIKLISEGHPDDILLEKVLELMKGLQK